MAKEQLTDGAGATKKKKKQQKKDGEPSRAFSDLELDVARQLVQLSGNSDESTAASSSTARRVFDDGTEASSALRAFRPGPSVEDDVDGIDGMRRRRKFRSLRKIYKLTVAPPSVGLHRTNKVICRRVISGLSGSENASNVAALC